MNRTAYNKIMDKVEITDEMRERILKNVSTAQKNGRVLKLAEMRKKAAALAACAVLMIMAAYMLPRLYPPTDKDAQGIQIANGIEECSGIDELSEKVGFTVHAPQELPFEPVRVEYYSYWGNMAQINYIGDGKEIIYRVSKGVEDNSGDYNSYSETESFNVSGADVTLKGDGIWRLAIWESEGFSYSLSAPDGMDEQQAANMISSIK